MRITDRTGTAPLQTTSTLDIPVGQVFRGALKGVNSGKWVTGVFYKAYVRSNVRGTRGGVPRNVGADHIIVRLDKPVMTPGYSNVCLYETVVQGYEPLDVELVIHRVTT